MIKAYHFILSFILCSCSAFAGYNVSSLNDLKKYSAEDNVNIDIVSDIDLKGEIVLLPTNGSIRVSKRLCNGTLKGNNTKIIIPRGIHFDNVFFQGSFDIDEVSYRYFGNYKNDTDLLRSMLDLTFLSSKSCTLYLKKRSYNIDYDRKLSGRSTFEYTNISNKRIKGNNATIRDCRMKEVDQLSPYDGVFTFSSCHDIIIEALHYQNPYNTFQKSIINSSGKHIYEPGIENQIGYVGSSYILLMQDCSRINISANVEGARYGVKVGDYTRFWLCGKYGAKNCFFIINAKRTGYPVAVEIGDSLNITINSDTHHRAAYLCGLSNSTVRIRAKNIYIAPFHCILGDSHYSDGDKNKPSYKSCFNLDVEIVEMGSTHASQEHSYCIGFATNSYEPFLSRKDALIWENISINVYKEKKTEKVGLFSLTRYPPGLENEPLGIPDVFKNISIKASDKFKTNCMDAQIWVSGTGVYDNVKIDILSPHNTVKYVNLNNYVFDLSSSKVKGIDVVGKINLQ